MAAGLTDDASARWRHGRAAALMCLALLAAAACAGRTDAGLAGTPRGSECTLPQQLVAADAEPIQLPSPATVANFTWTVTTAYSASNRTSTVKQVIAQSAPDDYHVIVTINGDPITETWSVAGVPAVRVAGVELPPAQAARAALAQTPERLLALGPTVHRKDADVVGSETIDGCVALHYHDAAADIPDLLDRLAEVPLAPSAAPRAGTLDFWVARDAVVLLRVEANYPAIGLDGQPGVGMLSAALTDVGATPPAVAPGP